MTTISVNGNFSDWNSAEHIDNPANAVAGYALYGTADPNDYYIGIQATVGTDPVIGAGTTLWLNTDQNTATGYSPFDSIGADYNVTYVNGAFYLYTGAAGQNLVSATPLTSALSPDGESLEIAIPRNLLTPASGPAPISINMDAQIDTGTPSATFLPADYNSPEYTITDPATLAAKTATHKVAIVYSDTSASHYFSQTAYSDLFMAAQNQARMAGVSYDVIDESQLTNINNLLGYDALIFPAMPDVNTAQLPAIMQTLTSAVQNYHIGIITSGDFLTNDQNGQPLPGNSYSNMQALLGIARVSGGNTGTVTVTANNVSNPIMQGYAAGEQIGSYTNEGYSAYQAVNGTPNDVLVNQNVTGVGALPGIIQTTTGGTNVHFATADLLGDSNLLSDAIRGVVLGTQPGVSLHISREAGIVAARMDMDQSQFPPDVSPTAGGPGIYDTLIPILQQWNQNYNFVGSFYVNIGDNPTGADPTTTDWTKSLPYYQSILATGSEIGTHSYTHLVNPPTTTFTATTASDTPAGSTQITLNSVPSFAGVTVGMFVTGPNLGTGTPLPGSAGEGGAIANTQVTAVSGNTITISYVPGGFGGPNDGTLGDIPPGSTLTFSIPAENTNFLQTAPSTITGSDGDPFTYGYEFNQPKTILQTQLGIPIYGAAIPGANETYATDQNILPYFQSGPGYAGYLTGGWTGIGSGYPGAIGYMSPTDQNSVYIAPNITFDFTEVQYQGNSPTTALAHWESEFNALGAHAAGTPIVVWPIHDYGAAAWNTTTDTGTGSPYTTQMYTDFIKYAASANYEFVTLEDLASRITAEEKASIDYTTSGNTITATVTPSAAAPDVGEMSLNVVNGGTQVIQNVTNWYAYDSQELFLPRNGGTFTINLGATQDNVTHIASLPMRADLLSVTGNGQNLSFSVVGSGDMLVDLAQAVTPVVTGATVSSLSGNQLHLSLVGSGQHDVTIQLPAVPPSEVVSSVALSADSGASASDFITNVAAQTVSGTLSAPLAAGDVVKVSLDNGATWQTATAATGAATFSLSGVNLSGSNTLIARVENTAGLASAALTKPYVLDQTPPATPSTPALTATSDNGASNTDNATSVATPTFTGTAEAGSTVTLLDGTATPIGTGVADPSTGAWTITASTLAPGPHSIAATATDVAGNVSAASTTPVVVNEVSPPTLMAPASATVAQGAATPITGISVAELGSVSTETFTVTLTDTNGLLSAAGTGVSGSGAKTLTITGSLAAVNSSLATLSVTDATTPSDTITINAVDSFGFAATAQNIPVTVTPATGQTYTLTTGADTVAAAAGANTIMAKAGTLNAGDNINGGTGPTTLQLSGGGAFNLATPATLTNIPTVTAQESTGATAQTITLRAGLNATVNVTPGGSSSGITIIGAANSDVINLGSGNDTVTLGAGETVNSGGGNNIFKAASAALGNVTINGGTIGKNTLSVTGGGTATMGAGITGINTVQLASATTFTANASAGLQIIGSTGADKITAGGGSQILSGGQGADTLTGSSAGNDIFRDTSASLNNDTIVNLLPSDIINFTDLAPATAAITKSTVNGTSTVLTLTSGATTTKITLSGSYNGNFALAADTTGVGGADLRFVPGSGTPTVTLPTTPVTLATGPVSTNIVATAATLLPADSITGGTGAGLTNQLVLSGGGAFNLAALAKLTNIQVITAQEGQGSTAQTITLRAGLKNATVNVAADTSGDPSPGITIIGTNDSDVINLGSGNDTVTLGANETVNGGSGADVYHVTRSTIGSVSIKGGTGSNTLVVDGGGTATMTSKITGINAVQLGTTTKFTANATAGLQISGSSAGGDTITLGAPTQSVVAGGPNETVKATVANSGASITGLGANSALEITNGGSVTLNAATDVTIVKLDAVSMLTLNGTAFISAVGSNGADTIRAGGAYQTLTGGAGADTLIGFAGGSDMFRDTAANLNGDTIQNFVNTDSIDLTNLAFAATDTVTTAVSGANTRVTVTAGATKSVFTMAGSWASSGFHLASDGATGTLLTHT